MEGEGDLVARELRLFYRMGFHIGRPPVMGAAYRYQYMK